MNDLDLKNVYQKLKEGKCNRALLTVVEGFNGPELNRLYLSNVFKTYYLKMTLQELQEKASTVDLDFNI